MSESYIFAPRPDIIVYPTARMIHSYIEIHSPTARTDTGTHTITSHEINIWGVFPQ